ncbi:hypothetical protein ACQEVB_28015 [Pseudonocardia sp. CA-107938]|uniref:hypothetical protein n=1 Tax=Pseudonocardia sp. CA-107938 TaxID=3240021 RepID=UPI003D8E743A
MPSNGSTPIERYGPVVGQPRRLRHSSSEHSASPAWTRQDRCSSSGPSTTVAAAQPGRTAATAVPSSGPSASSPDGHVTAPPGPSSRCAVVAEASSRAFSDTSSNRWTAWTNGEPGGPVIA